MVLATEVQGSAPTRALLLLAVVGGLLYGVWKVLGVGRRGGKLPPGGLILPKAVFFVGFFWVLCRRRCFYGAREEKGMLTNCEVCRSADGADTGERAFDSGG